MPGRVRSRSTTVDHQLPPSSSDDDDDADSVVVGTRQRPSHPDDSDGSSDMSSSSSKRRKLNNSRHASGSSRRTTTASTIDGTSVLPTPTETPYPRRQHRPGMIVRVDLKDFLTYTRATFDIGPSLNMVIGPNGTGKSSLVCAICLGLGWGPNQLGRAKDPGEFVKHGKKKATIEIELKGKPGQPNAIIRRFITKDNKSTWEINDRSSSQRAVLEFSRSFNIQIDNLCQFLPQDRVVEFSGMSPVEKLASTLQAAARPQMTTWYEDLKTMRNSQKTQEKKQQDLQANLQNLETRQAAQQEDVNRLQQRSAVEHEVTLLAQTRIIAQSHAVKFQLGESQRHRDEVKAELNAFRARIEPTKRAISSKGKYRSDVEEVLKQREARIKTQDRLRDVIEKECKTTEDKLKDSQNARKAEDAQERKREQERIIINREMDNLRKEMEKPAPDFDIADLTEQIRAKTRDLHQLDAQITDARDSRGNASEEVARRRHEIDEIKLQIDNLKSEAGQQLEKLKKLSPDTMKAWRWIKANRSRFEGQVYGPPIVEVSIKDRGYADRIESMLQKGDFRAITCTSRKDFATLSEELQDKQGLRDIAIRNVLDQKLTDYDYRPPVSNEEKQRLGIEGWAIEYLEGPEPVLVMLAGERQLHSTAVFAEDINDDHFDRLQNSAVSNWVTSDSSFKVMRRREYGPQAVSTTTRKIQRAQFWTNQPVDAQRESELRLRISELESEVAELNDGLAPTRDRVRELETRKREVEKELSELKEDKDTKQRAISEHVRLPKRLESEQEKMRRSKIASLEGRQSLQQIERTITEQLLKIAEAQIRYARALEDLRLSNTEALIAQVALIEADSDLQTLMDGNQEILTTLEQKKQELDGLKRKVRELTASYNDLFRKAEALPDEVKDYWTALPEAAQQRTPDEVDIELESLRARLEMLHGGDPATIRQFEDRARRIEGLKAQLSDVASSLQTLEGDIHTIRAQFEPELDALVARISAAYSASFERIHCAGMVDVAKPGDDGRDFDAWAVRIQVKFREGEPLAVLDSQRQSGGERAVSTIFYLMALQAMSRAPFRVVDEINQGMDQKNERVVHERLVDIAVGQHQHQSDAGGDGDGEGGSQYFLVTPKLLPGLKYAPGMVVHCIVSGEFVPAAPAALDLRALLVAERARKLAVAAAA